MKVLIVKLSAIGDVVHTIPFLRTLKLNFPHWEIDWVLEDVTYPLLRGNPLLRRVIELKRRSWVKGRDLKGFPGFLKALREVNYDLVIDLQGLLKSGIITFLSRGEQKIGLSISKELSYLFYRKVIEVDIERHALIRTLDVAKALGARLLSKDASIFLEPMERRVYEGLLSSMGLRQKE
ncbi:MAG: glycosyltransferase family 9 protein, partial [Desulfatiglandales bacterium]